ncbi:MAG: sporulation transcriptional regulator SpoIIID [Clostridia bacterium]|nr:sporulation transcriptional regulator SpoIIID [Clostridia bacterium]MBQ1374772.1 sporulation transcriptional regulator SpoIIID [Clostridia bacterium]MBQ1434352.1 sporulation transcriptional regulator SpoIIID [Clostridia bacterium]
MKDHIEERVLELARYITETKATVRAAARAFAVSKSTVHKDMTERLFILNRTMYREVKAVLEKNKSERHIRGGEATRAKYRAAK